MRTFDDMVRDVEDARYRLEHKLHLLLNNQKSEELKELSLSFTIPYSVVDPFEIMFRLSDDTATLRGKITEEGLAYSNYKSQLELFGDTPALNYWGEFKTLIELNKDEITSIMNEWTKTDKAKKLREDIAMVFKTTLNKKRRGFMSEGF